MRAVELTDRNIYLLKILIFIIDVGNIINLVTVIIRNCNLDFHSGSENGMDT